MSAALQVRGVRHWYGATVAVDGVDLTVHPGECVALLGPNGAGKSTLIGLATGLLAVQLGSVSVGGLDPRLAAARRRLGVAQQSGGFPRTLTVAELVRGAAVRAGRRAAAAVPVLAEVGLTDLGRRRAGDLSGGQRQRMALAMALVGDPALLLLDEPTVGLDIATRRAFWRVLATRRDDGTGLLLTTHIVEEAAAFADRVVVLHRGRVVAAGSPTALAARMPDRTISARTTLDDTTLRALPGVLSAHRGDPADAARVRIISAAPEVVLRGWLAADPAVTDLRVEGARLEEAVAALTAPDRPEVAA